MDGKRGKILSQTRRLPIQEVAGNVDRDVGADRAFLQEHADFCGRAGAEFNEPFELPKAVAGMPKVGFFPGSTIGNFEPHEACQFLRSAREILGEGALMIIGADLEKDERVLYDAYNDAAGVTARFNLNVLVRINRELGGNFDVSAFTHRAIYNRERHRIEMHLISRKPQVVRLLGTSLSFRHGESIHTESSYKYSIERFAALARGAGWKVQTSWTDAADMFSVHALVAE
jgi:dimethylhistidine N-methyltransferase